MSDKNARKKGSGEVTLVCYGCVMGWQREWSGGTVGRYIHLGGKYQIGCDDNGPEASTRLRVPAAPAVDTALLAQLSEATAAASLRAALEEALTEWDYASLYKGDHMREKHGDPERIAEFRARFALDDGWDHEAAQKIVAGIAAAKAPDLPPELRGVAYWRSRALAAEVRAASLHEERNDAVMLGDQAEAKLVASVELVNWFEWGDNGGDLDTWCCRRCGHARKDGHAPACAVAAVLDATAKKEE